MALFWDLSRTKPEDRTEQVQRQMQSLKRRREGVVVAGVFLGGRCSYWMQLCAYAAGFSALRENPLLLANNLISLF